MYIMYLRSTLHSLHACIYNIIGLAFVANADAHVQIYSADVHSLIHMYAYTVLYTHYLRMRIVHHRHMLYSNSWQQSAPDKQV